MAQHLVVEFIPAFDFFDDGVRRDVVPRNLQQGIVVLDIERFAHTLERRQALTFEQLRELRVDQFHAFVEGIIVFVFSAGL